MAPTDQRGGAHHQRVPPRERCAVVVVPAADDGGDGHARGRARFQHREIALPDPRVREPQPVV